MIIAYSMKKTQAGVRAPPVGIYTVENAFLLSQSAITFNVVMPVLCFVALFVLAFMAFSTAAPELARNPKFTAFVRYGFTNSCFLLSISEVPREYIPIGVAGFLHFALRILSDWSFFELVGAYFEFRPKFMRVIRPFYVLTLLAFIVQFVIFFSSGSDSSLFGRGFDIGFLTLRIAVPLLLLPHAMGIYAAFKMRKEWEGQVALTIFIGTFIFQTHDSLIFHGLASGIYFIKWYPLLVGYIFGLFFLEKARDLRTKAKIEQEQARQMHTIHEAIVGLAHDLEEPFKGVEMAFAELIRRPDNIELVKAIATTFPKKLGRVQELNRAILSFSKELSSAVTLEHEQVDLGKFIEEISDEFRPQPLLQGTVITVKSSSTVLLEIDSSKMRRVFRNLIRNAAEACSGGAGSRIDIEIKKSGGFIEIFISDNGPGISEKIKDRLFHPFESYGKVNGTGLGLAMSKRLVLAHGGDIVLEPSAQGARFKISLLID